MRSSIVLAMLATSSVVVADPEPSIDYALHVGAGTMTTQNGDFEATPGGAGPCVDGEVALRPLPQISVGMFGAFLTLRSQTDSNDQSNDVKTDARYDVFDLGGRVTFHHARGWGPLAGLGLAWESIRQSGRESSCVCANNFCNPCYATYSNRPYTRWNNAPLVEVHVGVMVPVAPFIVELLALGEVSLNPDDTGAPMFSGRLVVGARY